VNARPLSPNDKSALDDLVRQTFGITCRIVECTLLKWDQDYRVLAIRLVNPELRVIVKLAGQMATLNSAFDRGAALIRLVRTHTNLPNSGIIAVDITCQRWPWRYTIATALPGEAWDVMRHRLTPDQRADAYTQLGEAVATLHNIPFTQFGEVVENGAVPFGAAYFPSLIARVQRRVPDPAKSQRVQAILREHGALFAEVTTPGLTHEDLNPGNILFQRGDDGRWTLSGILDFESAWAGSPESDLARLEFWRGMIGDGFWDGYTSVRAAPSGDYARRRLLYQLIWCVECGHTTAQHYQDTRWVCERLGVPVEWFAP
jgi:aminoglycoside phosphotransferase (APT) family kinase protein